MCVYLIDTPRMLEWKSSSVCVPVGLLGRCPSIFLCVQACVCKTACVQAWMLVCVSVCDFDLCWSSLQVVLNAGWHGGFVFHACSSFGQPIDL